MTRLPMGTASCAIDEASGQRLLGVAVSLCSVLAARVWGRANTVAMSGCAELHPAVLGGGFRA
jgi:hypothetical protein